ncbi:MAG: hypothetical protein JWL71_1271 [Acidobacteria bacterium]|nr:hypothetical protein [Acidobacteriota bacterium]
MRARACCGLLSLVALVAAGACSSSPAAPAAVSTASPQLLSPGNGSQVANQSQPVTLVVQNAAGSKAGTTYTFEVASDVAFTAKVQTKDGILEGTGGQTSVKLDPLPAAKDYFWRARAQAPGGTGGFSDLFKFTVGPAVTLAAPAPISPLTNAETNPRPALRVTNASRSGSTGAITYKFEIARDAGFGSIVVSATTTEGVNETGYIPTSDLPTRSLLFWRASAIDAANALTSTPSTTQSFTPLPFSQAETVAQQLGVVLWPGRVPPGSVGHATMGDNWQVQTLHYLPRNVFFQSPDAEMIRIFDLLDRGFDPDAAAAWMNGNGYPTAALWYPPPEKGVIGLQYVYLASRNKVFVNGTWEVVLRLE